MILHAELFVVGGCGNIQHVFDPVRAVGDLQFVPIGAVILEPAVPVQAKTEKVNIETILGGHVLDHETRMDQAGTDLLRRGPVSGSRWRPMNEGKRVSLRVAHPEMLRAVGITLNIVRRDAMRQKVTSHCGEVVGGEGDFRKPVSEGAALEGRSLEEHSLARRTHKEADLRTRVVRACGRQPENMGIELAGFVKVADVDSYVIDAGNARAPSVAPVRVRGIATRRTAREVSVRT